MRPEHSRGEGSMVGGENQAPGFGSSHIKMKQRSGEITVREAEQT